jgi:RNA methyltransferase, rsmE family
MKQFITEAEPDCNGVLVLTGKAFAYLRKVRRIREGDSIAVLLPGDRPAVMIVGLIDDNKREITLYLQAQSPAENIGIHSTSVSLSQGTLRAGSYTEIVLLQWVLKGSKTDIVVRQAAEAGVHIIVPVIGEFSVARRQNPAQLERYRRIIKEARQQSGSQVDTSITEPSTLTVLMQQTVIPLLNSDTVCGMCSEAAGTSLSVHTFLAGKPSRIILAIGAEGGISPAETAILTAAGFKVIHFNTNVLRAETAALYAVAAMQTIINEADQWQLPASIS